MDNEISSYSSYMKSPYKSIKHSTYFPVYDRLFAQFAGKEITFVEVGVLNGGSLFMWRDFLGPKARIIGIDLNPDAKRWEQNGFEIFIGSQSDPDFWKTVFAEIGKVDILLDDGGHTFEQQITTVESALPHIKDGGLLVIEDTHTSYMTEFGGPSSNSFVSYAKNIVDGINYRFGEFVETKPHEGVIYSTQFFESFVVFEVSRDLCAVKSEVTDNGGKTRNAIDFRYNDLAPRKFFVIIAAKKILKQIPVIGVISNRINRYVLLFVRNIQIAQKTRSLSRFFKY